MKNTIKSESHVRITLWVTLLLVILATGCRREDSIELIPCDVDPWASDTCTFSLDKYNTTKEVVDYYAGHDSTIITHDGDTFKFFGWVYFHGEMETVYWPYERNPIREAWSADAGLIHLVGNEDHHHNNGLNGHIVINWNDSFLQENPWFVEEFDSLLQKKWYVTATMRACWNPTFYSPCHQTYPRFEMIALDTLPTNE